MWSQMIKGQMIKLAFDHLLFDHYPCLWAFFMRMIKLEKLRDLFEDESENSSVNLDLMKNVIKLPNDESLKIDYDQIDTNHPIVKNHPKQGMVKEDPREVINDQNEEVPEIFNNLEGNEFEDKVVKIEDKYITNISGLKTLNRYIMSTYFDP